jgi:uncharacterized Tic20 family protein
MGLEDVPADPDLGASYPTALTSEEKTWGMLCHLSTLLAYFAGGMTFLGPLVCWLIKKDSSNFVDYHGKESLNFQLNILVYTLICLPLICVVVGIFLLGAVHVYSIVCVIIAGIKASNGELFRYPFIFRPVK